MTPTRSSKTHFPNLHLPTVDVPCDPPTTDAAAASIESPIDKRFSLGLISYRTDSPNSSAHLSRVPSDSRLASPLLEVPSLASGSANRTKGSSESHRPETKEGKARTRTNSVATTLSVRSGRSLPSSLAEHIQEQRTLVEAAIAAQRRLRSSRSDLEVRRSRWTGEASPVASSPTSAVQAQDDSTDLPLPPSQPAGESATGKFSLPPSRQDSTTLPAMLSDSPTALSHFTRDRPDPKALPPIPTGPPSSGPKLSFSRRRPSQKSFVSIKSFSTVSSEREPGSRVFRAQHARVASASSHNLMSKSSVSSLIHAAAAQIGSRSQSRKSSSNAPRRPVRSDSDAERLNRSLGALPWPELPPRAPSAYSSASSPGAHQPTFPLGAATNIDRRPYSFLESDPVASARPSFSGSRRSSANSSRSAARNRTNSQLPPVPPKDIRSSTATTIGTRNDDEPHPGRYSGFTMGGQTTDHGHRSVMSSYSTIASEADVDGIPPVPAVVGESSRSSNDLARPGMGLGKPKHSKSMRSVKSSKTGRSKRLSVASSHYRMGLWEIEEGEPLAPGPGESEWRDIEDSLDLERLVARSLFLERMLRNGKRESSLDETRTLLIYAGVGATDQIPPAAPYGEHETHLILHDPSTIRDRCPPSPPILPVLLLARLGFIPFEARVPARL